VIDMAHDGDDGGARLEILGVVFRADEAFLDVGLRDAPDRMSEFLGHELGGVGVDHIGDLVHLTVLHQEFDDVDAPLGHAVGEFLDGNHLGHHNLALDLLLRQRPGDLLLLALLAALQRGKAPLALLLVERIGDGEPASDPALFAASRRDRALLVTGVRRAGGLFRLFLEKVLAGGLLADFSCFGLGLVPFVFFALSLVGLVALFRSLLFRHDLEDCRLLRPLALDSLTLARVGERARARVLFVFGKLRQHDADAARLRLLRLRLGSGSLGLARCRLGFFDGLRRLRADRPALLLLDQNGLRAPMAEALPHMAGLHRPTHVERHLAPSASGLAFSLVGLTHSLSVSDPFWLANAALPLR
jgi:hypothetical protein